VALYCLEAARKVVFYDEPLFHDKGNIVEKSPRTGQTNGENLLCTELIKEENSILGSTKNAEVKK